MRKLLLALLLLSGMIIFGNCRVGESAQMKPIVGIQCIMCDEVKMIIVYESTETHLLYKLPITSNYNLEIIDDEYG